MRRATRRQNREFRHRGRCSCPSLSNRHGLALQRVGPSKSQGFSAGWRRSSWYNSLDFPCESMGDPEELLGNNHSWLLIFAHPGHELRAHHLLERTRPAVAILTDGSGSNGPPRANHTRELLARAGARPAPVFCPLSDRDAYGALMSSDAEPFVAVCDQLASLLREASITAVVVDAAEGYNPVHDLCHWLGRAAVAKARAFSTNIEVFELDL